MKLCRKYQVRLQVSVFWTDLPKLLQLLESVSYHCLYADNLIPNGNVLFFLIMAESGLYCLSKLLLVNNVMLSIVSQQRVIVSAARRFENAPSVLPPPRVLCCYQGGQRADSDLVISCRLI